MEVNSYLVRERVNLAPISASGVVGTAANTVDSVSNVGVNASAAGLNLTLPAPTDTRSGRTVVVMNTGAINFTMYNVLVKPNQYVELYWGAEGDGWHAPGLPQESAADFWRTDPTGVTPDGVTDPADAIVRTGQTKIDTGAAGDSGLTLDDLRSRNSVQLTAGDGSVTDTNMTAIGVDTNGKIRLSNALSVPDLRATNPNPQDYAAGDSYTFKTATAIGLTATQFPGLQAYVLLETQRRYASGGDFSGGQVFQRVTLDDGRKIFRTGTGATTWGAWQYETQVQTAFNLQDLLQLNGTAKVSATGEVSWTNRFITMTAGVTPQEASGYHDISMPAVGATIPVQGGGTRTVVAATGTSAVQTGGIQLNNWETLWYRAVRGTANTSIASNFLITPYPTNATTGVPALLNNTSYPGTHAGEWIRVVHRDAANVFHWGTKDTCGLAGQFGSGMDVTIAQYTAFKQRAHLSGYIYATFATSIPTRVGLTGTIRWIDAGQQPHSNNQGYIDSNQAGRTAGTVVFGVNGASTRAWQTVTAADAVEKFGGVSVSGNDLIGATATVVQLADNETLYYVPNLPGSTPINGGTWVVAGYAGAVVTPIHWLPIFSHQITGANATTQFLVGGVQHALRAGEAVYMGKAAAETDRLHRRMGVTYQGIKHTRWTHSGFFAGAGANGLIQSADGVMVSWAANRMIYGISDGYASWGNQYTYINVPTVGTAIPVANTNGATTLTRVVTAISGRAYVPLGIWESLWFIPAAYAGEGGSVAGSFVITHYNSNHMVPVGAVRVAHVNASAGLLTSGAEKLKIHWADSTVTQPGIALASATAALRVENDQAQGSGDWRLVTVAGQTAPGMTAVMPAVAGVVGAYTAPYTSFYRYLTTENDGRGQIEVEGLILCNNNIVGTQEVAFMAGVLVRGNPITMAQMHRSTDADAQPIPIQLRWTNRTINGQSGVGVTVVGGSGDTLNNYATLGANGAANPAGIPQWIAIGPVTLPHA